MGQAALAQPWGNHTARNTFPAEKHSPKAPFSVTISIFVSLCALLFPLGSAKFSILSFSNVVHVDSGICPNISPVTLTKKSPVNPFNQAVC